MPDWRNPEDYAYCKHLTRRGWAWEFLRRSKAFISSWDAYIAAEAAMSAATAGDVEAAVEARDAAWAEACDPWGLVQPCDPSWSAIDIVPNWSRAAGVSILQDYHRPTGEGWPGYPSNVALLFDFRQPLEPQIKHA